KSSRVGGSSERTTDGGDGTRLGWLEIESIGFVRRRLRAAALRLCVRPVRAGQRRHADAEPDVAREVEVVNVVDRPFRAVRGVAGAARHLAVVLAAPVD